MGGLEHGDGRSRRRARGAGVLLLAVLAGAGLGRFATGEVDPAAVAAAPGPAAATDLAGEVAGLEAAVARDATDVGALRALGTAYVSRAAQTGDPDFYGLARGALDRAEALAPGDPDTALAQGALALSLHDFDTALTLGQRALAERPASAEVLGVVVDAHVELGQYDEAARALQRMLDRRPALPALARASYLRQLHGDLPGAVVAMEQARAAGAARPYDVAVVATLLGGLHLQRGDLEAAADAYDEALRLAPGSVEAEVGAARVLTARGETGAALARLREVVDRQPAPVALVALAELEEAAGDGEAAAGTREVLDAITALQEEAGQVVDLEAALVEADAGDPVRAVGLARRAHDARPDNVYAAEALAWALHRAGQSGEAVPLAEAALRLGTADPALRVRSATVLAAAGRTDAARAAVTGGVLTSPALPVGLRDEAAELAAAP